MICIHCWLQALTEYMLVLSQLPHAKAKPIVTNPNFRMSAESSTESEVVCRLLSSSRHLRHIAWQVPAVDLSNELPDAWPEFALWLHHMQHMVTSFSCIM